MTRLVHVVSFCIALLLAPACFAQSWPADLTIVSVLTMAKDLAETEPAKLSRLLLQERVARAIKATGQEVAFHSYVAGVSSDLKQTIPTRIQNDPDWQKNRELEMEARGLFLTGDLEGAKQQLRRCRFIPHYDTCTNSDYFLQFQFLNWELEAQNLPAALRRLRESDWKSMGPAMTLRVARDYITAGRQSDIPDILSELSSRFQAAAEQGQLQAGAAIRHAVNTGDIGTAMQTTLSRPRVADRVMGLTIIAEALANLPGPPDEHLRF